MPAIADEVTREIDLAACPEEVWDALTRPELLEQWLAESADIEAWDGGGLDIRTDDGTDRRGIVEQAERPERLVIRWWEACPDESTRVEFHIVAAPGGGSRLRVTESRTAQPMATASAWGTRFASLRARLTCAVA
jgi:uncharacterized protein YndB with AHSA1/START domain